MKKILNILFILALTAVYTSCTSEVDDVFDKSSAQRMQETLKIDKQILTSAANGWLMSYYGNTTYGGYNLYVNFKEDNTVTVSNELFGTSAVTSHYKLEQSSGVILSFDEYNELFHFFSNPANPSGIGTNGKGMEGDLEFRVLSASADSIVMKGKKHSSKIVMKPAASDFDWSSYINTVEKVENSYAFARYAFVVGENQFITTNSYRCFSVTTTIGENETTISVPYIVTDKGLEFYKPLVLDGKTVTGVSYVSDLEAGAEEWPALNDPTVKMVPQPLPLNEQFVNGDWNIAYSNLGAYATAYWNYVKSGEEAVGESLYAAWFGLDKNNKFGLIFYSLAGSSLYSGTLYFTYALSGDDMITMYYNGTADGDGSWYYKNANFNYAVYPFGYNSSQTRTFKITADDLYNPSYLILTDQNQANNVIKLVPNLVLNPFDN